jgi:hypothetical protein
MLVKPMNTGDLLRQIEALLVTHEDNKRNHASVASASRARTAAAKPGRKTPAKPATAASASRKKPLSRAKAVSAR